MEDVKPYTRVTKEMIAKVVKDVIMESMPEDKRKFVFYTGYGGMMTFKFKMRFHVLGRKKLPRKMKKRIFGTKKDRLEYIPEYYSRVR